MSFSTAWKSLVQSTKRVIVRTIVGTTIVIGTLEITTELPSHGRASWFYHYLADDVATPFLRKFLDAESAHNIAISIAKAGLTPLHRPSAAEQRVSLQHKLVFDQARSPTTTNNHHTGDDNAATTAKRIKTIIVDNPIGVAAGFDKDGEIIQPLLGLGFGLVEIGTVTPRPQPGNARPRMFRLAPDHAIINRYGFNSAGATAVLKNVLEFQQQQHEQQESFILQEPLWKQIVYTIYPPQTSSNKGGLVGINIGKNKSSTTPQEVIQDYVTCIQTLGPVADYLVINVSSPNTAGLRDEWQQDVSNLQTLLQACIQARNQLVLMAPPTTTSSAAATAAPLLPPLFVKLAPDLTDESLRAIVNVCLGNSNDNSNNDDDSSSSSSSSSSPLVDGIVVTNTTTARPADLLSWQHRHELGGLSGEPLKDASTQCIRKIYALTRGKVPIIGVGGIGSGQDAYEKLCAGASLVQVYSTMVYQGPGVISRIRQELATLMRHNGQRSIADVVGADHADEIVYTNHFSSASYYNDNLDGYTTPSSSTSSSAFATSTMKPKRMAEKGQDALETVAMNNDTDTSRLEEEDEMSSLFPNGTTAFHGDNNGITLELNDDDDDEKKEEILH